MIRRFAFLALACAALLDSPGLGAQAQAAAPRQAGVAASRTRQYYKCIAPKTCTCWAFSDDDKKVCPECTGWQSKTIATDLVAVIQSLDTAGYKNAAGAFVAAASHSLYGVDANDVTVAELYRNPGQFGFRELPADSAKPGTFVVYPNIAGLVLNENKEVAYPSSIQGGKLRVLDAAALSHAEAKVLVPAKSKPEMH